MPSTIEESIEVQMDLSTVYNQWTQFEDFPHFMNNVKEVRQLDETTLHWTMEIGGSERDWKADITEQKPDERIAWAAQGDIHHAGVVTFHRIDDRTTRVMLQLDYEPEDWKEKAADALGMTERRVRGDLERFKEFIEERGRETGAYRGEVGGDRKTA